MMKFALIFGLCLAASVSVTSGKVVSCYFESWAVYEDGDGSYDISDIDPTKCTHALYAFAGLDESSNTIQALDPDRDINGGGFSTFTGLKSQNPNLKTILSCGGWSEGSTKYSNMAKDASSRATFISSVVAMLQQYGFDGFDLDWEYPTQRGGSWEDKANYVTLLTELKSAFQQNGYLLSVAVGAGQDTVDAAYDVPGISAQVDFIHVMTYDFHGDWDTTTGHNSPYDLVTGAMQYWVDQGASPSKLVLGTAFYGHSFTLSDPNNAGMGAPVSGPGNAGPYSQDAGYLNYNEVVELQNEGGWVVNVDSQAQAPYASKGDQWVGYDDPDSLAKKVQYAESQGLAGVFVWAIDGDDFKGKSGTKNPLLTALNNN